MEAIAKAFFSSGGAALKMHGQFLGVKNSHVRTKIGADFKWNQGFATKSNVSHRSSYRTTKSQTSASIMHYKDANHRPFA